MTVTVSNDRATADGTTLAVSGGALTVTDDDAAPNAALSLNPSSVSENGGTSAVSATLTHPSSEPTTVTVTPVSGAYTVGSDATIVIAAGETANATDTAAIAGVDNAKDEPDRTATVTATLTNSQGAGTVTGATLTLTDDDDAPNAALSLNPASVSENGGASAVSATLTHPSSEPTTVTVTAVSGFYTVGSDAVIVITAGSTANATDTAAVAAVDNAKDEPDRTATVTATLTNSQGAGTVTGATLTLTDDDGEPSLSIDSPRVDEGDSGTATLRFVVTLSAASGRQVTVGYGLDGTDGGTATAGTDYTAISAGTLTFTAGTTSRSIDVAVRGDTTDEADETIRVTLSGATNATGTPTGTGTITDDDDPPAVTLALADASIAENGGSTTVTATLSHPSSAATTVTVTGVSGLYTAGADATIVIAAGATANAADTATIEAVNDAIDNVPDRAGTVAGTAANAQATAESETMAVTGAALTITDDDAAGFAVSPSTSTTSRLRTTEDGGTAAFEVELGSEPTGDVVLGVASSDTTEGTVSTSSLTFTATTWNTAQTVTLTGVDDAPINPADGDRSYTVTLTVNTVSTADAIYDALSAVMVYAVNADNEYGLDVSAVTGQATEAGGQATFTVALLTRPLQAVTVTVSSLDASGNPDTSEGTASPSSLTFAATAWNTAQMVTVTGADDAIDDGEVTWNVRLDPSSGDANYNGLSNVDVLMTTTDDDDAPGVVLAVSPSSIAENGGVSTVSAALTHPSSAATTVTVTPVPGFYTVGSDATIVIAAGSTTNATGTATIAAVDNDTDAPDRAGTVTATVSNDRATTDGTTLAVSGGALTVTDDDAAPNAELSLNPASVSENGGASAVSATLTHPSSEPTTVTVTPVPGLYTVGSDATIVIAAGSTANATDTAAIAAVDNATDEPDRTATVTATLTSSQGAGTVSGATLTLEDDDAAPTLSIDSPSVTEGDSGTTNLTFTVTLSAASGRQVTVAYADATTGTATSGTDYTAITGGTLTFTAGTTSRTFNVAVTGDALDEANETVVVTLSNAGNATLATASGTGTITDNDATPTLSVNSPSVTEGDSGTTNLTFTVTLSPASGQQVTVDYADATTGTATSGTDYTAIAGGTLTFPAGTTSRTFDVSVTGDALDESNETVVVTLSNAGNATLATASGTGTITDNDATPTLSVNSPSVTEGDSGTTNLTFTVTLSAASGQQVTVDYADATTGTATAGIDYTAIAGGTLTFTAGTTSRTFDVSVTGDTLDEANETVVVTLSNAGNATLATASGTGTITDNDATPTLSVNSPSVTEGDSGTTNLTFTVTLSAASGQQVTVDYADATTGTATSGTDYTAIAGGTLTFAAGTTSQTFNVSVTGDTLDEANETVVVSLSSATNATVSNTAGTGTGTITDDDDAPTLSIASASVTEGDSGTTNLTFTVTLSAASGQQVTVDYADATTGTATSGTDYTAIAGGTLTFTAGTTSRTFDVAVTGDVLAESNETVVVTLSNAGNATISTGTGTGTITDNDATPTITLTVDDGSVGEGDGATTITVTATVDGTTRFGAATTVTVSVAGSGTATAVDFAAVADFDIEIAAGAASQAGTFTLTPTDDTADETDEDHHGERRVGQPDGEPGHDHVDGQRRRADAVDRLAERDGG